VKIALLTYSTKPRGGVVHTLALAEALAARGQDVTVWTLGRGGDEGFFRPVDPSVRVAVVPFPDGEESVGARILRSIEALREAFPPDSYDIVHAQDCISANAVPRCLRTVHHIDHFTTPELAACHERAITQPFGIVCVSRAVADEVAAGWGIRAAVIPNGVDSARFARAAGADETARAARERWRSRFGRYVLAVGGIEPRKGSLDLLEAYARLRDTGPRDGGPRDGGLRDTGPRDTGPRDTGPRDTGLRNEGLRDTGPRDTGLRDTATDVRLVIAGGETLFDYRDYRSAWEERCAELFAATPEFAPAVLGPVPDESLPSLVAAAGAFCFPSVREGFGLAALEALAAGVPLVTRSLPVLHEVFGGTARFASDPAGFAAALREALDAPGELRAAGRDLAARYTWAAAADAHLALYARYVGEQSLAR
jgi:glycosyltransferase involved in cell wall biosynthesis